MSIQLTQKAVCLVLITFLFACPFVFSTAAPLQSALPVSSLASGTSVKLSTNSSTVVRHATVKIAEPPVPAVASAKQHDKKTLGRCWKRLMDMMREVRQAHHNKR